MVLSTVLRFTHGGGNTDFYDDEVKELDLHTVQDKTLLRKFGTRYYHMYYVGNPYYVIDLYLLLKYGGSGGTLSRMEDIFDRDPDNQPETMECFYEYGIDSANSIWVQMKRDTMVWPYKTGYEESKVIKLTFYEAVPEGIAVTKKRIGV